MLKFGSCRRLFHEDCDYYVVLEEEYCKKEENVFCFPVINFSIEPFGNIVAAVATTLDLSNEGTVCVCDKGGCGRSGTVAAGALAYAHSELPFSQLKKMLRNEYGLLKECPEKPEQLEAVRMMWAAFHFFGDDGFRLLTRTTYVYTFGKPSRNEEAGAFVVNVTDPKYAKKAKFLPIRVLGKRIPYGREARVTINSKELRRYMGIRGSIILDELERVRTEGKVVRLEELTPDEVLGYALSYSILEGMAFKTLNPEEGLVLLTKSLLFD
ncbi:hypothetical protein IPA_03950 [Ignicoccus pacificus DSM 13166]|uniref:Uncharacterized protein n=1 Tax=Ignicoccus pacificus DSM 13166 TaxID=940294 RepID=A0A977KB13_9CREN|nr:hypothetical protein IPA_03950 [Ignicoccus pacificus DSM 13166]